MQTMKRQCPNSGVQVNSETGYLKDRYLIYSASKIAIDTEWVKPLKKVVFEGMEVTTFSNTDAYLRQHYGDEYSKLPPEEKRRVGINRIDF
jgi:phosphorylcholine metabolism protein LicD